MNYKRKLIEMPVLAHAIEDSTDIFGISGRRRGLNTPNPPGTPLQPVYNNPEPLIMGIVVPETC